MLRLLFDLGAKFPNNPKLAVNSALEKNEIGVVEVLLDNGLNPELLSPDEHDKDVSPVHAAFKIDVSKGKGMLCFSSLLQFYTGFLIDWVSYSGIKQIRIVKGVFKYGYIILFNTLPVPNKPCGFCGC